MIFIIFTGLYKMKQYNYYKNIELFKKFMEEIKKNGVLKTLHKSLKYAEDMIISRFLFLKSKKQFYFKGKKLNYFYHRYNKTWKNERAIEIPIALEYLSRYQNKKILEIGNVLNHYLNVNHVVIDKYEIFPGVINKDIENICLNDKFDLIISISTIEHIGLDDYPKDPEKAIRTLKKLKKKFLKKDGIILISFPFGYNEKISEMINKNKLSNFEMFCFKKINEKENIWKEVEYKEVKNYKYSQPVKAVCFLKLTNKTKIK